MQKELGQNEDDEITKYFHNSSGSNGYLKQKEKNSHGYFKKFWKSFGEVK